MAKIKLELEIEIDSLEELYTSEFVDNLEELQVVYKSQAKRDVIEFLNCWTIPIECKQIKIEE